jgi:4-aminobutyrate aminotransferase-like enzyme
VIVGWTLHRDTVVRLAPPLVLTDEELERALAVMRAALGR